MENIKLKDAAHKENFPSLFFSENFMKNFNINANLLQISALMKDFKRAIARIVVSL